LPTRPDQGLLPARDLAVTVVGVWLGSDHRRRAARQWPPPACGSAV